MDMQQKLTILADAAKYDASCASSGSSRKNEGGLGVAAQGGICHSWSADGRCISLLKVLFTNHCVYDCAYCQNRRSNDLPRAAFTPDELADLTIAFYKRNYIEGLFLSSGVVKSPDHTMELMIHALTLLRKRHRFSGYVHVKTIPGASDLLIQQLGQLADRISCNIEMPSGTSLSLMAPEKTREHILAPMGYIKSQIDRTHHESHFAHAPQFAPAGQSTQMIVGATPDTDRQIMMLAQGLYKKYRMRRVYYSAYVPVNHGSGLPDIPRPPMLREHRLYQTDWLIRLYGFTAQEIFPQDHPNLDPMLDPKAWWALTHIQHFPIEVNTAPREMLLRVPGIGLIGADRIVAARRACTLREEGLKKLGIVMRRARHFITANGAYLGSRLCPDTVRTALIKAERLPSGLLVEQTSFIPPPENDWTALQSALAALPGGGGEGHVGLGV